MPLPDSIGDVAGEQNIASMWHDHFKQLLNSVKDKMHEQKIEEEIAKCTYADSMQVNTREVNNRVKELKHGKASGFDSLSADHLKFSDQRLCSAVNVF